MRYLLLLYGDESQWAEASPEDIQRSMEDYGKFGEEVTKSGAFIAGEGLEATNAATTVRVRAGEAVLSDGPFAETREQLGGFYLLECRDLDEAVRWASKIPAVFTGSVEIRPVMNYEAAGFEQQHDGQQANA
jgi:hypothetical protein